MRAWLTVSIALLACGDDPSHANLRCEQGPELAYEAVDAFAASGPACTRDDECALINTTVECDGLRVGSCGTIVHRDLVKRWDPRAPCAEIERLPNESGLSCSLSPSCDPGVPACVSGRCSARP